MEGMSKNLADITHTTLSRKSPYLFASHAGKPSLLTK
jgi:hypothetical protein